MNRLLFSALAALCAAPFVFADEDPLEGLVNFETPHVHPLDLTPDGNTLLAVNTAMATLEVFDVTSGTPVQTNSIPVGLDPVSVRVRTNGEAWVVNHVSDSISVVDLGLGVVIATLDTENEPADVVFAGVPQRAFVSCSEANAVQVFDPLSLGAAPTTLALSAEEPRALAVSPDGSTVYAAAFESGNRTIALNGRSGTISTGEGLGSENVVSRPEGPYSGQNPAPNSGTAFDPPLNPTNGTPPDQSILVRQDTSGAWMDDNGGDWSIFVGGPLASLSRRVPGWTLPDHDVAIIDAQTLAVSYEAHLMNLCMAIGVRPTDGRVTVVGTDAINEVRFEPNVNGIFLRVLTAGFGAGGSTTIDDLNPHLDYSTPNVPLAVRTQSIGDPRGVAWRANGASAFVTGMGSNNVVEVDGGGVRLRTIPVGQGPTGLVLDESRGRVHVLNKFAGSISSFDLTTGANGAETAFFDPTPQVIKDGRPFLYDTHLTSGLGHVSCASCHVDARTDRLAWDLGDPSGPAAADHPMKGPMLTQSLVDIIRHPRMHWRGDRAALAFFNPAFVSLMGADAQIANAEMDDFEAFLDTIHFPPNPYRNIDNTRPVDVLLPDGRTGSRNVDSMNACIECHLEGGSRAVNRSAELSQDFIGSTFHAFYERLGYRDDVVDGSTSGFGYFHDGADPLFVAGRGPNRVAEILLMDGPDGMLIGGELRKDVHAGVGRQLTISGPATSAQTAFLSELISIAVNDPHAALIAKGRVGGELRGYLHDGAQYQSDRASQTLTEAQLLAIAESGDPVTWTLVAEGTQTRLGIDADLDGTFDWDEDPEPLMSITSVSAGEADGTVEIELTLNVPHTSLASVTFQTLSGGTATPFEDYLEYADRIEFAPGVTSQTVTLVLFDDLDVEGDETVLMRIFDPFGAGLGFDQAVLTIVDDDVPPIQPLIQTVSGGGTSTSGPWSIGYRFTVTDTLRVVDLGVYDANGNGVLDGPAPVGLWNDTTGALLATTTVPAGTAPDGQFFFAPVTPLDLQPGTDYLVAAVLANGGEPYGFGAALTHAPELVLGTGSFVFGATLTRPTGSDGNVYVGPNLRIESTENLPPSVNAGPDGTADLNSTTLLAGSVTDDGASPVDILWSKVSGPGNVNFGLIFAAQSPATFYVPGTYVLRLTADDGVNVVTDEVTVVVGSNNLPPVVDAGPDFQVEEDITRILEGSVTDDGPIGLISWEKVSGPGGVNFLQIFNSASPAIIYLPGTYVLRLTADDGQFVVSDEVTVTVVPTGTGNPPPVVSAGPDLTVSASVPFTLQGTVTDTEVVAISWSKLSGPGGVQFALQFVAETDATIWAPGTYVLRLTADDGVTVVTDEVTVTVQ